MRILVITPVHNDALIQRIESGLRPRCPKEDVIEFTGLIKGPAAIDGFADEAFAAPEVLRIITENENAYDGFFINCFGDVAVDAARELTRKPVFGAGEASYFMAAASGVPFSIVTVGENARNKMHYRFRELGCSRYVSSIGILEGVLSLSDAPERTAACIVEAAKTEQMLRGAELIVLGCTGMIEVCDQVRSLLPCPVIEPGTAGIQLLLSFLHLGLSHARGGKYLVHNAF